MDGVAEPPVVADHLEEVVPGEPKHPAERAVGFENAAVGSNERHWVRRIFEGVRV